MLPFRARYSSRNPISQLTCNARSYVRCLICSGNPLKLPSTNVTRRRRSRGNAGSACETGSLALSAMQQMTERKMVRPPFDASEYQQRLTAVRQELNRRGLDLLVVTDVANQHYL